MAGGGYDFGEGSHGGDAIGPNPTDRAKKGTKRSLLVEAEGGPLALIVAAANVNDPQLLRATIEAIVVERPSPGESAKPHLTLDKGYDVPLGHQVAQDLGYRAHIRRKGEAILARSKRTHRPRHWVVERTFAWLSKCRAILVRYDKKAQNYRGLLQFACVLLWYRRRTKLQVLR
jgi:putative transposase